MHPEDLKTIQQAAETLRTAKEKPYISNLAANCFMSVESFKLKFKAVYNVPPYRYYLQQNKKA